MCNITSRYPVSQLILFNRLHIVRFGHVIILKLSIWYSFSYWNWVGFQSLSSKLYYLRSGYKSYAISSLVFFYEFKCPLLWEILNSIGFRYAKTKSNDSLHFFFTCRNWYFFNFFLKLSFNLKIDALALILFLDVSDTGGLNRFQNLEITQHWIVNVIQGQISESTIT